MERLVLWHRALPAGHGQVSAPEELSRHVDSLSARVVETGGELLGSLGGAVVASFAPELLTACVELALAECARAEASEEGPRISFGLSVGLVEARTQGPGGPSFLGDCIDRAQLLANRARAYELLLDAPGRQRAAGHFLFGRVVGTGSAAARGYALDRTHPHRRDARDALEHLASVPVATVVEEALAPSLAEKLSRPRLLVTRGPEGAGLGEALRAHVEASGYAFVLSLRGTPGGLECLGSLKRAVRRAEVAEHAVDSAADPRAALREVLARPETTRASTLARWHTLLAEAATRGGALVILDLHQALDVASVALVGAGLEAGAPHRVVAELPLDSPMPRALGDHADELLLPPLRTRDARKLAGAILKLDAGGDLARRVAVLGGDTPMGVEEAARTLVAAGDLLYQSEDSADEAWRWRVAPRGGVCAIPVEALLEERVEALDHDARRLLDVLAAAPTGTPDEMLRRMAARDGLDAETTRAALDELHSEALLRADEGARMSQTLREHLLLAMPPARVAELRRYLAEAWSGDLPSCEAERATLGYLWAEGGESQKAAVELLAAAQDAQRAGWARAAVRLAAIAVQTSPTEETRRGALALTRDRTLAAPEGAPAAATSDTLPEGVSRETLLADLEEGARESPTAQAVRAMLSGDFETVDGLIDLAVAEGHDLAATDRLRAMAHLLRSDMSGARRLLDRSKTRGGDDPRQEARAALALAWVRLRGGLPQDAIRDGLHALALSRQLEDGRGESAAMHTLAACYRKLGRAHQAQRIEEAAPT